MVTGAASGIGRACAEVLTGEGRAVSLWDSSPAVLDVGEARGMSAFVVDVTDDAAVAAAVDRAAAAMKGIDGLVHAAGRVSVDPIGALTARSRKEDHARCLAAGMDAFLTKPIRVPDLLAAIERLTAAKAVQ